MGEPAENLEVARRYLQAIERGATGAELRSFFTSDVVLEEFPNRVVPLGKGRGLAEALEGAQRAKKIMSRQIYKITRGMADQDRLAPEVEWVGTLAVAFGTIPAGGQMKAFLAVFLDSATGRSSRSGTTIVSRPGDARDGGSTRVLLENGLLWYLSAIVLEIASRQYGAVWARFVLVTSLLLFCRFGTLLTRLVKRTSVDRSEL